MKYSHSISPSSCLQNCFSQFEGSLLNWAFFEKYLGCRVEHKTQEVWLLKHGNVDIVIKTAKGHPTNWPKNFHFGFELKTVDEVRMFYETFKKDGIKLETEVFNNSRGSRFFARSSCSILIEINTRQDMDAELWQNNK